jgi:hypothetical protein
VKQDLNYRRGEAISEIGFVILFFVAPIPAIGSQAIEELWFW